MDLLLEDEIKEALEEDLEDYDFATELILEWVAWQPSPEDDAKIQPLVVPERSTLAKQLQELERWRFAPRPHHMPCPDNPTARMRSFRCGKLNRHRLGAAVQQSTFESEKGALLRSLYPALRQIR